jgi:hypothetical protein
MEWGSRKWILLDPRKKYDELGPAGLVPPRLFKDTTQTCNATLFDHRSQSWQKVLAGDFSYATTVCRDMSDLKHCRQSHVQKLYDMMKWVDECFVLGISPFNTVNCNTDTATTFISWLAYLFYRDVPTGLGELLWSVMSPETRIGQAIRKWCHKYNRIIVPLRLDSAENLAPQHRKRGYLGIVKYTARDYIEQEQDMSRRINATALTLCTGTIDVRRIVLEVPESAVGKPTPKKIAKKFSCHTGKDKSGKSAGWITKLKAATNKLGNGSKFKFPADREQVTAEMFKEKPDYYCLGAYPRAKADFIRNKLGKPKPGKPRLTDISHSFKYLRPRIGISPALKCASKILYEDEDDVKVLSYTQHWALQGWDINDFEQAKDKAFKATKLIALAGDKVTAGALQKAMLCMIVETPMEKRNGPRDELPEEFPKMRKDFRDDPEIYRLRKEDAEEGSSEEDSDGTDDGSDDGTDL